MSWRDSGEAEPPRDPCLNARRAIEKQLWDWGIRGDMCALLAEKTLLALADVGHDLRDGPKPG